MQDIPNIPNARYTFDFSIIPSLLFGKYSKGFIASLTQEKEIIMAKLMNDFYNDIAKHENIKIENKEIFSPSDFKIILEKFSDKGPFMIHINMPTEKCSSIVCLKHFIVFDKNVKKPRLFTLEVNPFLKIPFLCEVNRNGNHSNYGPAPETDDDLIKKIFNIYK